MAARRLAILGCRGIPAAYGGFETFAEEIAVRLSERDIEVTVYCESSSDRQLDEYKGIRLKYIKAPSIGVLTTVFFDIRCLWESRKKFDVVYMLGYGSSLFCFIPRIWGTRVWINMDGIEYKRSKWGTLARVWFRFCESCAMWTANRLIADAESIKEYLLSRHSCDVAFSVIPYGADVPVHTDEVSVLSEFEIKPFAYYVVICRLEPENPILEIINGFIASKSQNLLIIFGDISISTAYVQKITSVHDPRIRFVGTLYNREELYMVRQNARAYFHGHSVGGTNPSLLEALASGNNVVVHDNPFNREVAGQLGKYFLNEEDVTGIVAEIDSYSEEELRREEARHYIRTKYSWEHIADLYYQLLDRDFEAINMS